MSDIPQTHTGLVVKSAGSRCWVRTDQGRMLECSIKGKFRIQGIRSTNPVAVGDRVVFNIDPAQGSGVIHEICDRKNYVIRKASNLSKESQILAANVDLACLVVTLRMPETHPEFIDRFLAATSAYRIPACVVFNKTDLYDTAERDYIAAMGAMYRSVGYQVLETSVPDRNNIDALRTLLSGKISVLAGNSGVGKSSLINMLEPGSEQKIGSMSLANLAGKHTTTYAEMMPLSTGGYIIDTPGIRGFGLVGFEREEIYHFFPEIFEVAKKCQYNNCLHVREPGCAVKEAVENSRISVLRYTSYLSIMDDEKEKYR